MKTTIVTASSCIFYRKNLLRAEWRPAPISYLSDRIRMRTCSEKISPHHDEEGVYLLLSKKHAIFEKIILDKKCKICNKNIRCQIQSVGKKITNNNYYQ
jgi:hypothetical protein